MSYADMREAVLYTQKTSKAITAKFILTHQTSTDLETIYASLNHDCDEHQHTILPKYLNKYCKPSIAGALFWNSIPNDVKI